MPIDPNNDIAQAIATARQPDLVTEDDVAGTWSPRSQPISGQTINSYSPTTESAPLSFSEKLPKVLYSHFVDPVVKAVTAPGRVYRGEVPEDQMIDEAKNVAGQLMTGSFAAGVPTALREGIEPNVLRTFAGPASKTAETTAQARQLNDIGLYSHAAEQANTLQPRGDAKQMISTLKNMPGVKAEELQNAGLLDAQGNVHPEWADRGKITNTDLADHLQSSMPQVQETILGFNPSEVAAARAKAESQGNNWDELGPVNQGRYIRSVSGRRLTDYQDDPKYAQYTLPGGENYREVLLTTPVVGEKGDALNKIAQNMFGKNYTDLMGNNSDNAKMRLAVQREYQNQYGESGLSAEQSSMFRSNHWDDPNVLAHLRMSDRTGPNGEKILHVEELQSDWGQKGRDNGFKSNDVNINDLQNQYKELDQKRKETYDQLINEGSASVTSVYDHPDFKQITDKLAGLDQQIKKANNAVPSAPYVTNTGSWTDLALKRALKEAAEGGYDKLVWTPGSEQAQRYDLSKQIDRLEYIPTSKELIGVKNNQGVFHKTIEPNEIENYAGKEIAKNLLAQPIQGEEYVFGGFHALSGQDLSVGGEGMKSYYNSIVPKQLQKITKQYDPSAKVGYTDVMLPPSDKAGTNNPPIAAPGIDITPQMRETIMRGQKAFKRGGEINGDEAITHALRLARKHFDDGGGAESDARADSVSQSEQATADSQAKADADAQAAANSVRADTVSQSQQASTDVAPPGFSSMSPEMQDAQLALNNAGRVAQASIDAQNQAVQQAKNDAINAAASASEIQMAAANPSGTPQASLDAMQPQTAVDQFQLPTEVQAAINATPQQLPGVVKASDVAPAPDAFDAAMAAYNNAMARYSSVNASQPALAQPAGTPTAGYNQLAVAAGTPTAGYNPLAMAAGTPTAGYNQALAQPAGTFTGAYNQSPTIGTGSLGTATKDQVDAALAKVNALAAEKSPSADLAATHSAVSTAPEATATTTQTTTDPYAALMSLPGYGSEDPADIAMFNQAASKLLGTTVGPQSTIGVLATGQRGPDVMVPSQNPDGTITMQPHIGSVLADALSNVFAPAFVGINSPNYGKIASQVDSAPISPDLRGRQDVASFPSNSSTAPPASTTPAVTYPAYIPPVYNYTQNQPYQSLGAKAYNYGVNPLTYQNAIDWTKIPGYGAASGGAISNNNALANSLRMLKSENKA